MVNYNIHTFSKIDSTQKVAKEFARKGIHNFVIVAEEQNKARGRFNREWAAEKGGLYFTLILKEQDVTNYTCLTLLMSITVNNILHQNKISATIKWPNDLLINGKKACGILTETLLGKENYILIGVGLNVNQKTFPKLNQTPTSLFIETKKEYDCAQLLNDILEEFDLKYSLYQKKDFEKIRAQYKKNLETIGKNIIVKSVNKKIEGTAIDIDKNSDLIVQTSTGQEIIISEGDVTEKQT